MNRWVAPPEQHRSASTHEPACEPLDALAGVFAELARYENTNGSQIAVIDGVLDIRRLADAVRRAARAYPMLLGAYPPGRSRLKRASASGAGVAVHHWDGACDLADPAFRALLMTLSDRDRIDWHRTAPFRVYLIVATDYRSCCVFASTAQAAADVRGQRVLLERIMREYGSHTAGWVRQSGFVALRRLHPDWYTLRARACRGGVAAASLAADAVRRDIGLRSVSARAAGADLPRIDFYWSRVDGALTLALTRAVARTQASLDTFFAAALVRLVEHGYGPHAKGKVRVACATSLRTAAALRNDLVVGALRVPCGLSARALLASVETALRRAREPSRMRRALGRLDALTSLLRRPALYPLARALMRRSAGTNVCYSNAGAVREDLSGFGQRRESVVTQYAGFGCLVEPFDLVLYTPMVNGHLQIDAVYRRAAFENFATQFAMPLRDALRGLLAELDADAPPVAAFDEE